jgi:hypothetical protein
MPASTHYGKAQALRALRALGATPGAILFRDLPPPLRRAVHLHWGSMSAARRAANLPQRRPGRSPKWTAERVIAEIQHVARRGQHMSQNAVATSGYGHLVTAACHLFGSWSRARDRASVPFKPQQRQGRGAAWDADTVVAAIRERLRDGETLAVTKCPSSLVSAAQRHFGSWREAVEAVGLDYKDVNLNRRLDDAELLDWLRDLAASNPSMTLYDLDRLGGHVVACRRRWGSLAAAAEAAGIAGWPARVRHEAMSRDEVLAALRLLARRRAPISLARVRANPTHQRLVNSVFKRFASWNDAISAAGMGTR